MYDVNEEFVLCATPRNRGDIYCLVSQKATERALQESNSSMRFNNGYTTSNGISRSAVEELPQNIMPTLDMGFSDAFFTK